MLLFLVIFFILSACAFLTLSCTRRYRLGQLAKHYNMQYEYYRESITTVETAGQLEFFIHFFHQYYNVCTFSSKDAFMRLADDVFFADDKPGTKAQKIFVFTAELKNQQFIPFKIVPAGSVFAQSRYPLVKTNVPEIDAHYQIYSPIENTPFLTPSLRSVLKNRRNIYLEANESVLVYHESTLTRPQDFQTFRLRGMQLLHECIQAPALQETLRVRQNANEKPAAAFEAGLLLPQGVEDKPNTWMGMGIAALLLLAVGFTLFAWILIRNLPH